MTTWSVLGVLRRRWVLLVVGGLLTTAALVAVRTRSTEYYATVDVRFLAPVSRTNPNAIQTSSSALVDMAGLVKADVNRGNIRPGEALGLKVRGGSDPGSVYLPDTGNQFVPLYTRPVLVVEATAADATTAVERVSALADRVRTAAARLQRQQGAAEVNDITTQLEPPTPQVRALSGDSHRAMAVVAGLGAVITVWATVEVDAFLRRRTPAGRRGRSRT